MWRFGSRCCIALGLVAVLSAGVAPPLRAQPSTSTHALITDAIDDSKRVALTGNIRPEARTATDLGPVDPAKPLSHLTLQLKRAPADEAVVAHFIDAQHDPASPQFHHWLTAEEWGARFGAAQADIDRVTAWLTAEGFTVNAVAPGRLQIDFSGTAGLVARAFHTEIHRLDVAGTTHIANVSDPSIPAALAPVVEGVVSLNDFRVSKHNKPPPKHKPPFAANGNQWVAPGDLAVIYNFASVFKAGITGKGQTIGLPEPTDLFNYTPAANDWVTFRHVFGLDRYTSGKLIVEHSGPNCTDPGVGQADDEATLDTEWSSAAAPDATILMVACADTDANDGVTIALFNLINMQNGPKIISISYGTCEAQSGAATIAASNKMFQQAAGTGISIFTATGDGGPPDCGTARNQQASTWGIGANSWATTAYNVAVGGTDFTDVFRGVTDKFWGKSNGAGLANALSYIPEAAWNNTCGSILIALQMGFSQTWGVNGFCNSAMGNNFLQLDGGEGAPSGCFTGTPDPRTPNVVSGTCKGNPKPGWQSGVRNIAKDGVRDTPDIAFFASDGAAWGHQYARCFSDPNNAEDPGVACTGNPANWAAGGGGTSYATPIMAGVQALVNQKTGTSWGNPAPTLYKLAARQEQRLSLDDCHAFDGATVNKACVFHDLWWAGNAVDCVPKSPNCYAPTGVKVGVLTQDFSGKTFNEAYVGRPGWDFVGGLGTPNVGALLAQWSSAASP